MAVLYATPHFRRLTDQEIAAWSGVPSCVASDVQNRGMTLPARIKPLKPEWRMCGQARTALPTPGDNGSVLHLSGLLEAGEIMVVAAGGHQDVALAGELVTRQCRKRGAAGILMDGTMRDGHAILQLGLPIFCSGLVPRGPVKEYGGFIDVPVGIGALSISPGDLIIGDMDGVTVVPLIHEAAVFKRCQDQLALEEKRVAAIEEGGIIAKLFDVRKAEPLE